MVVTENCRRVKGVWLCFGGGGSGPVLAFLSEHATYAFFLALTLGMAEWGE